MEKRFRELRREKVSGRATVDELFGSDNEAVFVVYVVFNVEAGVVVGE